MKMTNDQGPMTKECLRINAQTDVVNSGGIGALGIGHSLGIGHWPLVIL